MGRLTFGKPYIFLTKKAEIWYNNKNKPYEFLFAVMMSAQCTDARVNIVTKDLFKVLL